MVIKHVIASILALQHLVLNEQNVALMMMFFSSWKEVVQKIEWCPKLLEAWRIHEGTPFGLFF
jgi:hypothetical protein